MTEAEWLACGEPRLLLGCLLQRFEDLSPRRLRLAASAFCRRVWTFLTDERSRNAVEVAERYSDGLLSRRLLADAKAAAAAATRSVQQTGRGSGFVAAAASAAACTRANSRDAMGLASSQAARVVGNVRYYDSGDSKAQLIKVWYDAMAVEAAAQAVLFRDVFGNPFRPVSFDAAWRTDNAVSLAQGMYESRDFSAMPILADAMQDAGCENEDVLNHCRDEKATHVRGCWVVDLVLDKT